MLVVAIAKEAQGFPEEGAAVAGKETRLVVALAKQARVPCST